MRRVDFEEAVEKILLLERRYDREAYYFVRDGLDFAVKMYQKPTQGQGKERHVSGQELTEAMRIFALQEFGPMALTVLRTWGFRRTEDFGEIVFHLVEQGTLRKTPEDRKEDFAHWYDFDQAFGDPFRPHPPGKESERGVETSSQKELDFGGQESG